MRMFFVADVKAEEESKQGAEDDEEFGENHGIISNVELLISLNYETHFSVIPAKGLGSSL